MLTLELLRAHDYKYFKVNIEVNHTTLAGLTFKHELVCAFDASMIRSNPRSISNMNLVKVSLLSDFLLLKLSLSLVVLK